MKAPARLTALRLVGFKSFAERTTVEFGPGISAVVGPNGSGKSNLADALRWTLGEAGRSLRTRRAEDVIFAGSSIRRAISMADVTLVIDNADRLLPLDFAEVELGRRLYRSGENEYLLNRQRVRLRDLTELLDAGNLADNAFLFIGQGMVDQALALRPEERRPLFEEAAGVRRHERRRRHAEAELAEAETNLERLRDLLGELRPQARRLAAQAEQLQARQTAGLELATALVAAARGRWSQSATAAVRAQDELAATHAEADAAMAELRAAEEEAERLSRGLGERAEHERRRREDLERMRSRSLELRLQRERGLSETAGVIRDRERLAQDQAAIQGRAAEARLVVARSGQMVSGTAGVELAEVERDLVRLTQQLATESAIVASADETTARARGEVDARTADVEAQRRRATQAKQELAEARDRATVIGRSMATAVSERDSIVAALAVAEGAEATAEATANDARHALDAITARHAERKRELADAQARLAALSAQLEMLDAAMAAGLDTGLVRAARARNGSLVAEGLEVEPRLGAAVAAALGEAARGVALEAAAAVSLAEHTGVVVASDAWPPPIRSRSVAREAELARVASAATGREGGLLNDAIRRDPQGHVVRLLARSAWVPALSDALAIRHDLPDGWSVATLAGELVNDQGVIRLGGGASFLDQRAQRDEVARQAEQLNELVAAAEREAAEADRQRQAAATALAAARSDVDACRREHRVAQEAERVTQRRAEALVREHGWETAQLQRLEREVTEAAAGLAEAEAALSQAETALPQDQSAGGGRRPDPAQQSAASERLAGLRARRDRLAAVEAERAARQAALDDERRRAEVLLTIDETRAQALDDEARRLVAREADLVASAQRLAADLALAEDAESRAEAELEQVVRGGADERARLQQSERAALKAREKLRAADVRSRSAEVAAMEARLHLEQVREQLLVELAGIGPDGLAALANEVVGPAVSVDDLSSEVLGARLEAALDEAVLGWEARPAEAQVVATGRLAALRRRFHELGASNPFAVQEYAEVRARLEELEAQRNDLDTAIHATRELIAGLSSLITDQFRQTFTALEGAFARRFEQLFDGGEAQLSLTAPEDLSATGVEITARPPGKRRQPLAMLSGGERALTAVALLLAMLEVRPVPFCVLDEVDAALDEANIGRFATALRGLADTIQFIVITHNRGTIEAADALYGVTIGEDAVSRIVSLRLPFEKRADKSDGRLARTPA
ncbi:chromosome segregation protein SMC [soil metagenome]